jgi:hypothetical protein
MVTEIRRLETQKSEQFDDAAMAFALEFQGNLVPIEYARSITNIPNDILLGHLLDGRLKVISPIKVVISQENEHIIAEAVEVNEFGFGNNFSEALIDLQHALAELYYTLGSENERLGSDLLNVWQTLQNKITKR